MRRYSVHIIFYILVICHGSAEAQIIDSVCASDGPSHLAVPDPPGNYFDWHVSGATILSGQGSNDILVQWPNTTGVYDVWMVETGPNGCLGDTVHSSVYVEQPGIAGISGPSESCVGSWVQLEADDVNPGGAILWGDGSAGNSTGFVATHDTTVMRVAYNEICGNDTAFHFIKVNPVPLAFTTDNAPGDSLGFNREVDFSYTGTPVNRVDWYLNNNWSGSGEQVTIQFSEGGWNEVVCVSANGSCSDTVIQYFYLADEVLAHLPTSFSPNGDGVNDVWYFSGTGFDAFEASIFNRWGQVVYSWNDIPTRGWDGTFKGDYVPTGVYTYRIRITTFDNSYKEFKGIITLIR